MGACVFNNQIFDSWLTKMSEDILSKVNREKITTEEMIILILKAQTNHFHHMDVEMKDEMDSVRNDMTSLGIELKKDMTVLRNELKDDMTVLRNELKDDMTVLRNELKDDMTFLRNEFKDDMTTLRKDLKEDFNKLDTKMDSRFMWSIGVTITMSLGLYIKLFLG